VTCLLAIDTATRYATVAVSVEGNLLSRTWFSQHNHGVELLPRINETLSDAGRSTSDITHIAVVMGPGSFSALRVGLATAQGMALAGNVTLVPIPTFELEIEPWTDHGGPICAAIDAGSTGLAWGLFVPGQNGHELEKKGIDTPADLAEVMTANTDFCGESAQKLADHVSGARILSGDAPTRSAESLMRLALRKLNNGESSDPSKVEITYARAPNISTPKPRLPDGSRAR
jgi:tRNA threonylcarbamoyladenosine biosynthesis protein TsaB